MRLRYFPLILLTGALQLASGESRLLKDAGIERVYLLKMGSGLDQYLANRLTEEGVFEVVTDPALAQAVITDQIGESFESRFEALYPPPPEPKKEEEEGDKDKDKDATAGSSLADAFAAVEAPRPVSPFSRGRGNVFLVLRTSKTVVWSVHEPVKRNTPQELHRTAGRIVTRLQKALGTP